MCFEKPDNFNKIKGIFLLDLEIIKEYLLRTQMVIFYDTCSLGNHARLNPKTSRYDILDAFTKNDLIIITNKILEEMVNSETGSISDQYIEYLRCLKQNVKEIILLYEDKLENLMLFKFNKTDKVRSIILDSVKEAFGGFITSSQHKKLIYNADIKDSQWLMSILHTIDDACKKNRGEISILICLLVIDKFRKVNFRILTEDKKAYNYFLSPFNIGKTISNISIESTVYVLQDLIRNFDNWEYKTDMDLCCVLDVIRTDQGNKILYKNIIEGKVYQNIVQEKFSNCELVKKLKRNDIEIVF